MICRATLRKLTPTGTGRTVGHASFLDTPQGLAVRVEVEGLAPGEYGMHLHEHGACGPGWSEADKATIPGGAAGPHYDPRKTGSHKGPGGDGHAGDLPRFVVRRTGGMARQDFLVPGLKAIDVSGRTLILHEGGDNYADKPKPNGGAGGRQICGSIVLGFQADAGSTNAPDAPRRDTHDFGDAQAALGPTPILTRAMLDGQPHLCVPERAEASFAQPLRLATGLVGGPLVGYGAWTLREQRPALAAGLAAVAVGMSAWSLYAWNKVDSERSR